MSDSYYAYMTTKDNAKMRIGFWPACDDKYKSMRQHIILLTGRATFMERYDEVIQKLVRQHFNVWSFDWRGQGLSSRLLKDPFKGHIDAYDTYLRDLDQFIIEIVQPTPDQIYMVMAQSMGAHIALRYLEDYKNNFSGVMLISPMLDILTGKYPRFLVQFLTSFCAKFGWAEHFLLGNRQHDVTFDSVDDNYYTPNTTRYQNLLDLQKNHMSALVGRPTYGWLHATLISIKLLLDPQKLRKIDIPIFFIDSGADRIVDNRLIPYVMKFLKSSFHKTYPQAGHQIFLENDDIIHEFWQDFDYFANYVDTRAKACLYKNQLQKTPSFIKASKVRTILPTGVNSLNS